MAAQNYFVKKSESTPMIYADTPFVADIYDFRFVCKDICEMTYLFMGIDAEKYGDDGIGFGKKL